MATNFRGDSLAARHGEDHLEDLVADFIDSALSGGDRTGVDIDVLGEQRCETRIGRGS